MGENNLKAAVAGLFVLAALSPTAVSATPAKDIQVAARVLTFLENGPSGRTIVGVVFDPSKPQSVAEKNAIMAAIGTGYSVGGIEIVGRAMEEGAVTGVKVEFLTHGVDYAELGAEAKARKAITIGSDPACVTSGACLLGISTDPTVQIVVNHTMAAAVGAVFKAAFRMMIHEI